MNLDTDTPESLAWQEERNASAAAFLAALPARDAFAERVAANLSDTRLAPLQRRGNRWFQKLVLEPTADQEVIVVRDAPTGEARVLLDPNELTAKRGLPVTAQGFYPSPDGQTLAVLLVEAGTEQMELRLIDVSTGETRPETYPWVVDAFTWLPDSSGFWCCTREVVDGHYRSPVYRQVLGAPLSTETPVPTELFNVKLVVSPDERYVALHSGNTEQRMDWIVRDGEVHPFLPDLEGGIVGRFAGDDLIAVVEAGAPRGRLVRIPVATAADESTWTELLAESEDVLRSVDVIGDVIVLGSLRDAASRLRLLDLDGQLLEEIDLAGDGTTSAFAVTASHPALPMVVAGDDEISFLRSTFDTTWSVYRYVVSERRLELVTPPAVTLDGIVVRTITATSSDGVEVPAHVVHRADLDTSVPQPTLLYGYGGFNLAYLPGFNAEFSAWVQAGGVYVLAHLRGGSEYGAEWWHQGRRETKQLTFDDLYAVAEQLISDGTTTRQQLAVKGESNGGLLTGAAIVQRPDLWAAVVSDVPIFDLLGFHRDPLTYAIGRDEYGDPLVPEEAEWLRRISPVHNVRPASYPSVLITAGANDPRCPTWHARSLAGLLEEAHTGETPILLRVYTDQGHGASGLAAASSKSGDWLAFVAEATGLRV